MAQFYGCTLPLTSVGLPFYLYIYVCVCVCAIVFQCKRRRDAYGTKIMKWRKIERKNRFIYSLNEYIVKPLHCDIYIYLIQYNNLTPLIIHRIFVIVRMICLLSVAKCLIWCSTSNEYQN